MELLHERMGSKKIYNLMTTYEKHNILLLSGIVNIKDAILELQPIVMLPYPVNCISQPLFSHCVIISILFQVILLLERE